MPKEPQQIQILPSNEQQSAASSDNDDGFKPVLRQVEEGGSETQQDHPPEDIETPTKPQESPPEQKEETHEEEEGSSEETKLPSFEDFVRERTGQEPLESSQQLSKPPEKKARDYSDIDEPDRELFKRMSNEAYEKLKPVYKEHRTLKQELAERDRIIEGLKQRSQQTGESLPPSYYSHPEAYRLTKDFALLTAKQDLTKAVFDHWQQQLVKIRRGEDWTDLTSDEKGNIVFGDEKKASVESELAVTNQLEFARNQMFTIQQGVREYVTGFKSKHDNAIKIIKDGEAKFFPGYDDPKHPTAAVQKAIIEALPPEFRDHPLASPLKKVHAVNILLHNRVKALEEELKAAKGLKKDASQAQPTKGKFAVGSPPTKTPSYEDFLAERGEPRV